MGTTTKMAIPYPEATGLVKDGWEDMKDIATQVDAKSGLVLLNTTSFSAVSSQSISSIFSSTFDHYKIILSVYSLTNDGDVTYKLRTAAGDDSSNIYASMGIGGTTGNVTAYYGTGNTSIAYLLSMDGPNGSNAYSTAHLNLYNPFATRSTTATYNHTRLDTNGTAISGSGGHIISSTTSYTGISFIASAGTITGKLSVFGYNQ